MLLAALIGGLVAGSVSILLPKLLGASSGWSVKFSRWFGALGLGYVRTAGAAVFGIAAPTAIGLSASNVSHRTVTYVVWYSAAFVGLVVAIASTVVIDRRTAQRSAASVRAVRPPQSFSSRPRQSYGVERFGAVVGGADLLQGDQVHRTGFGEALRLHHSREKAKAVFVAVEAEVALAHEEALEMIKLLRAEWPYITPDSALVQTALPDWRDKTTEFIGLVLGSAQRAAFKGAAIGPNELERLESEGRFLNALALSLKPESIRVDEAEFLEARAKRRTHRAAGFLDYNHHRAPGAPPPEDLRTAIDALMREGIALVPELSASVQPERTAAGHLKISGEDAPDEWWEKSNSFFKRATDLLTQGQPALLKDFEDGFNAYLRKQREAEPPDHASDKRSTAEKMLAFANAMRSTPRELVEATLDGLTEARRRLGSESI